MVSKGEELKEDEFDTADAISIIFDLVKFANINTTEKSSKVFITSILKQIEEFLFVIGIKFENEVNSELEQEVLKLIEERTVAKKEKDFARADEIRDYLLNKGVTLEDTRSGVKWSYRG